MSERLHWFWFCFEWARNGKAVKLSTYMGRYDKDITMAVIDEARDLSLADKDSLLISCSYLGCMTKEKFTGKTKDDESRGETP